VTWAISIDGPRFFYNSSLRSIGIARIPPIIVKPMPKIIQ